MKKIAFLLLLLTAGFAFAQQGGMWIPSLLEGMNAKEMRSLGMKMSVKDIYNINKSSLKDAVPHFNGGCTSEIISPKGLLLTNHHCGYGQIQAHSTVEHNYLEDGFWAKNQAEELPNKNLEVTFIVRIDDVTTKVLAGTEGLSDKAKAQKIEANIAQIVKTSPKESWQENRIKAFYEGNQYILFVVETFKDVRLVGAPPSSIGKFGSDTDNWMWPRHTGDFSLFRVYADKNNHPAAYSPENVPYKPKHYFPVSLKGVKEGDFTMVMGYPGQTQEYLPAVAVKQIVEVLNPAKIGIREVVLKAQDEYMRKDPAIKIKYASKYARIANYWKKWIGETKGLIKSDAVAIKQAQEVKFQEMIKKAGKEQQYGDLLPKLNKAYTEAQDFSLATDLFSEFVLRNIDLMKNGNKFSELRTALQVRGNQSFEDRKANLKAAMEKTFKDYDRAVDKASFEQAVAFYAAHLPKQFIPRSLIDVDAKALTEKIYNTSFLATEEGVQRVLSLPANEFIAALHNDVGMQFVDDVLTTYYMRVASTDYRLQREIADLQQTYMKAILEFSKPSDRIFPNANSTLRVTYGKIAGYTSDQMHYEPFTYLDGVMAKYKAGDYEFDVPEKLRALYDKKDYGIYGKDGKMPVCFISTAHTTGGNSGSPAIDAKGNLIGLNFDRVWDGTMSDILYDPALCRNIMVDIRYVLFIIDKYADANYLIKEMKIVK